jgi:hypothetical protein
MAQLVDVVKLLKKEHDLLSKQLQGISAALSAFGASYVNTKSRTMSAAGRERIAAAQRRRWSKVKKTEGTSEKPRTMSTAARKKISLAQKARWAKAKKAA